MSKFYCQETNILVDLDWCLGGCGKRNRIGSIYCSSDCFKQEIINQDNWPVDINVFKFTHPSTQPQRICLRHSHIE
jgi:hypothetical protein